MSPSLREKMHADIDRAYQVLLALAITDEQVKAVDTLYGCALMVLEVGR